MTDGAVEEVTVPGALDGMRVDRVVSTATGLSRALAAELVAGGAVLVDGAVVTARSSPVAAGSVLQVTMPGAAAAVAADPAVAVPVVHEDADLVVVDKPAGMVVHPGAGVAGGTLVSGLLARYPDLAGLVADGTCAPDRPGIVQRLDRGTSGLMVVARTARAYRSLVEQLTARTVVRRYLAVVAGLVHEEQGVVDAPIGRSTRSPTRMGVRREGRPARTGYQVLARRHDPEPLTLLVLTLETGRTHQIRVHLAAIGHPVVGDDRYARAAGGGRSALAGEGALARSLPPRRLFLHAARLGFEHPADGEYRQWDAGLPAELAGPWRDDVPGGW